MATMTMPAQKQIPTPDFETYPLDNPLTEAGVDDGVVGVTWADGHQGRFHFIWLRDNCPMPGTSVDPDSRERTVPFLNLSEDIRPQSVVVTDAGGLRVIWADSHESLYHPGWLRTYCYSDEARSAEFEIETWDGSFAERFPIFYGPDILEDDEARYAWLAATQKFGISLLTDIPTDFATFEQVAGKIGLVRDMSWGKWFEIISEPHGQYLSNKSGYIPPHTDGPTREYFPGIQVFQCVENSCQGGESFWVDGFHVAKLMREQHPAEYEILTTVSWELANREKQSHYRWNGPIIVTDRAGNPVEIRDIDWLRAPLMADFDLVLPLYRAYRCFAKLTNDPANQVERKLQAGEIAIIDNRRCLHARRGFDPTTGHRHLRTAYTERDELRSALRLIERNRNQVRLTS
jgi:gamma-butyrobetaine dioxygenase